VRCSPIRVCVCVSELGPSKFRGINKHVTAFVLQPSLHQPQLTTRLTFTLDHARIGHPRQHPSPFPLATAHPSALLRLYNTRSHTTSHIRFDRQPHPVPDTPHTLKNVSRRPWRSWWRTWWAQLSRAPQLWCGPIRHRRGA